MTNKTSIQAVSILFATLLTAAPAIGEDVPESIQNEPTAAGSPRTSPGTDSDRIPDESIAPRGAEGSVGLGESDEETQEDSGASPFGSPTPGEDAEAEAEETEGDKRIHGRERDRYMKQEEVRQESQEKMRNQEGQSNGQSADQ